MYRSEITQFRDKLFLADWKAVETGAARAALGITAIISILENPLPYTDQPNVVQVVQWDGREIDDATLQHFLDTMKRFEVEGQTVVIHCQMGISRTPAFAIFWELYKTLSEMTDYRELTLIPRLGLATLWSVFEDEIKAKRSWTMPHTNLKVSMLKFFEQKFLGR